MGITADRARQHILEWQEKLTAPAYAHRARWPSRLFHHAPIENAASILRDGQLLSRNDSQERRKLDVAGASVIQNRILAHQFARLYFRPRTPTQYHIEGVRSPSDYYDGAHAPTLVMLIFDSLRILTQEGVGFSTGNMQASLTPHGFNDEFFDSVDFAKVFHQGGIGGDYSIINCRCAEVLVPSPMPIADVITSIYCRSEAERMTLLHDLGPRQRRKWGDRIQVSDDLRVFEKRFTFVEHVSLQHNGVVFRLHPSPQKVALNIKVWKWGGRPVFEKSLSALPTIPTDRDKTSWITSAKLDDGEYRVQITIEGCRVFEDRILLGDYPF
jgi:ssDNA thymidine ADP-ribosyltransferase, DarT